MGRVRKPLKGVKNRRITLKTGEQHQKSQEITQSESIFSMSC